MAVRKARKNCREVFFKNPGSKQKEWPLTFTSGSAGVGGREDRGGQGCGGEVEGGGGRSERS